jgi:cyclopropane-fatty-acyl-phospholipid synthase
LLESDVFADALIRSAIRRMLRHRLAEEDAGSVAAHGQRLLASVAQMNSSPMAFCTDSANAQHYEGPRGIVGLSRWKKMDRVLLLVGTR